MKKLLVLLCLLVVSAVEAQAPQYLNYQGIARDASGNIITTAIGVKFEILQGGASGTLVYDETNTIMPSSAGIFTTAIGSGAASTGTFSAINWANSPYFLRISIDPAGGTSYSTVGTSELLSVPYALYAEKAGNTQTVSITGPGVSGSYPNYTITPPGALTASTGISISGGTITNTAPDQPVTIVGLGSTTVSGAYPNFTISTPVTSTATSTGSLQINPPHTITNLGPGNNSITIQPTNISGPNVVGSYPNYTIGIGAAPNIIGTGVTNVIAAGNNYTVNTPPVNMTYLPGTGMLTYIQATGSNTLNISPAVTFTNNVITVGSNSTTIPVTGIWTRPTTTVTTLTNVNDNVGIGISTPGNRLHVVESANGLAAVKAVNTYTTVSNPSAMGLWAESSNPNGTSAGVYGVHNGGGNGVSGISTTSTYSSTAGVYGYAAGTLSTNVSVQADVNNGNSIGVFVNSFSGHTGTGLYSLKAGSGGNAAKMEISNTANSADALLATTNGIGAAIHAINGPTVAGSSNAAVWLENGHLRSTQTIPPTTSTVSVSGGGISSVTVTLGAGSTDVKGTLLAVITTTGIINSGNGFAVRVNFNKSYTVAPVVVVVPSSDNALLHPFISAVSPSSFTVTIKNGTAGNMSSGTTFAINLNYMVIE